MIRNPNDGRKIIEELRQLSRGNLPLVNAFNCLMSRRAMRPAHKHALVEGMYILFRRIVPIDASQGGSSRLCACVFREPGLTMLCNVCFMLQLRMMTCRTTACSATPFRAGRTSCNALCGA